MTWHNPVRVLIASANPDRVRALTELLERHELEVQSEQVTDADTLTSALARSHWDLLLCCREADAPMSPERMLNLFRGVSDGIALLFESEPDLSLVAAGLQAGAHEVLLPGEDNRLQAVLERELQRLQHARATARLEQQVTLQARQLRRLEQDSGIAIARLRDGQHDFVNQAYADLLGHGTPEHLLAVSFVDMLAREDRRTLRQHLQELTRSSSAAPVTCEVTAYRADRQPLPLSLELEPGAAGEVRLIARPLASRRRSAPPLAQPERKAASPGTPRSSDSDASAQEILELLSNHILHNTLVLLFQPTICLHGEEREHYEVYLRMPGRDGNLMVPDDFIHLAEQAGIGGRVDRWVVLHALRRLSAHREHRPDACLTINLTHSAYTDPRFLPWLKLALQAARFPKEAVVLQISEPTAALELGPAAQFTQALSRLDCLVSLSHFGESEDPFKTLKTLHIDYVKLDGQFVLEHIQNDAGRVALQSLLRQLQSDGFRTVVPMVSDVRILARLFQAGATHVQGNYFAGPGREMDYEFYTKVGLL